MQQTSIAKRPFWARFTGGNSPILRLLVIAIAAGGFFVYKKRTEARARAIDSSFEQLEAAGHAELQHALG
mgnify:CR=1 FL=1